MTDIFDDVANLRLSTAIEMQTTEVVTRIAVRKPQRHEFFRACPDPARKFEAFIYEDKLAGDFYLVPPEIVSSFPDNVRPVRLTLCINRQGGLFLWPVPLPNPDVGRNAWHETARDAAPHAETQWTRLTADKASGCYRIHKAVGEFAEPTWPDMNLSQVLRLAFEGRVIELARPPDHPPASWLGVMKTSALAVRGSATFVSIWMIDFEFNGGSGEKPDPLCLVAHELQSGQTLTFWRDELRQMQNPPFSTGADTLVVSFYASAEIGCFIALGWKPPENLLDLYVENIASRNGLAFPTGRGLLGALAMRGLSHMSVGEKEDMRDLILNRAEWSPDERASIIEYCRADVGALTALYAAMEHQIDFPRALLRGRYMTSVAHVEANGVPIDGDLFARLCNNWESIKLSMIEAVDVDYGVYRDGHFRKDLFQAFLQREAIPWPRLPSGEMALDRETFRSQARAYPVLRTLYELRVTLDELRLNQLTVGKDGRNRYLLSPFGSVTGRNQPSNSKAIFGPARWIRGLIKPPPEMAIGYIDYSSQEIGIAAALSGDELLMEAYREGDPYLQGCLVLS